jgi:aminoglycoside 3-N-acetyltransferase
MTVTKNDICKAIEAAGLSGELICVHSSLRSFGEVEGGADTIINAFLEAGCTLLAPSFTYRFYLPPREEIERNGIDDEMRTIEPTGRIYNSGIIDISSDMGAIPRTIVYRDGRYRGGHPSNSFVALGPEAEELISCQTAENVYAPFQKMMEGNGKIVMMGVDLTKMTAIHYAEQLSGRELFVRWALDKNGSTIRMREGSCSEGFNNLLPVVADLERQFTVGNSLWRIFPIKETVQACAEAIRKDRNITHCGDKNCIQCNDMQKGGPKLSGGRFQGDKSPRQTMVKILHLLSGGRF